LSDNAKTDRANAQFAKLQKVEEGKKATSEYESERMAVLAKTERLKALRLARDAAQQDQPAPAPAAKTPARGKKNSAKSLAGFLNDQNGSGRRS
jgi:hypothetical protein